MQERSIYRWGILPLWLLLASTVFFRNPIPIDETRYLSVAWEMWLRGDFWVPYLNGQPYGHKPPLLFWLFHVGWAAFGVNEWWPKLVGPFFTLIDLFLVRKIAGKLWPEQGCVALLAPWILIATLLWTLFATAAMFDILLTSFVLLAMLGLIELSHGHVRTAWLYLALAIGFGLLAKGPVVFLHVLPTALLSGFWAEYKRPYVWLGCMFRATLAGVGLALLWAIPAGLSGGKEYANSIFWQQIADRTVSTEIHARPFLWYFQFLPLILFPWVVWPRFWKNLLIAKVSEDKGMRFCVVWAVGGFLVFSLLQSKQVHYLVPVLPGFALLGARILSKIEQNNWLAADLFLAAVFGMVGMLLVFLPEISGLATYRWVQSMEAGWGLAILAIAASLTVTALVMRKLSVGSISTAVVAAVFAGFVFFFRYNGIAFDLRPAAIQLKAYDDQGIPCAFVGNYQGQLHFLGRLTKPLPVLSDETLEKWVQVHPNGYLISVEKEKPLNAVYRQPQREYWLVVRKAAQASELKPL